MGRANVQSDAFGGSSFAFAFGVSKGVLFFLLVFFLHLTLLGKSTVHKQFNITKQNMAINRS